MVIWLIGLSASGKTTIGRRLHGLLDSPFGRWVLVDGDAFREVMGDAGHDLEERRKNAYRISRLCRFLELQNLNVVACVLSLFPDNREHNRGLFADYREVYVKAPLEKLAGRDNKGLYAAARSGALKDVAGVDIPFPEPTHPHFVLDNTEDTGDFTGLALRIAEGLGLSIAREYGYPRPGQSPEKYQYTPFEGPGFLPRYRTQREKTLADLESRIARLESGLGGLAGAHFLAVKYALPPLAGFFLGRELSEEHPPTPAPGTVSSRGLMLESLRGGGAGPDAGLFNLLKRFEVTKKVHSAYRVPEWRKAADAEESILDRILLALALLDRMGPGHDAARGLIAFNAVLKLNDLLAAGASALATPGELYLAKLALALELKAFSRLQEAWHG